MPTTKKSTDDIKTAAKPAAPKKTASRAPKKAKAVEPPVEELSPEVVEAINVIKTPPPKAVKQHERIFALDIGTRSVIGIVAEEGDDENLHVIATDRLEHKTRAMLDGQIHDVPQVAAIVEKVKNSLIEKTGPIKTAAVAAAGRALYTMTAEAEMEVNGLITAEQQRNLDFAGVQAAQAALAESHTVDDPSRYYCVGYSTIRYVLDDIQLKMLIGQRGKKAKAVVIATFLPRQVIDSMQSALHATNLEMRALTLEPIAAINVLIPPTMRHLNLVLVDIGAGTSDVAITKNGSVIAYGMVPLAGDEVTEAISQRFLLDFNIAERIKRQASSGEDVKFTDILGTEYTLTAKEILEPVMPNIENLANAIAKQIFELNGDTPQAVMLVGGGSQTPGLAKFVADALGMPENRVAVRKPDMVDGIVDIPEELHYPDAVTPLGILKIASLNTLHFLSVYVNDEEYSLFNFRELTVSDALLNAGINLRKYNGHPGLGLMVNIGTEKKFFPGTLGTFAKIMLGEEEASLDTVIRDGARITVIPGENGTTPTVRLGDLVTAGQEYTIYINGREKHIRQRVTVNGKEAEADQLLADGDVIESREFKSLGEALLAAGYPPTGRKIHYKLNGKDTLYSCTPEILLNDAPASISMPIHEGDHVEYIADEDPKLGEILNIKNTDTSVMIYYEDKEFAIPSANVELMVNGRTASPGTIIDDGCEVTYHTSERLTTTVSDALLAVNFQPPAATSRVNFTILVNGQPVDFTDPVKNGDTLEVKLTSRDVPITPSLSATPPTAGSAMPAAEASAAASASPASSLPNIPGLSAVNAAGATPMHHAEPSKHIPGLAEAIGQSTGTPPAEKPIRKSIADFIRRD
ncbi:cell division FtsA domain-containing protein [Selenomonas ruminantium]|uniref:Cell division protein FtsA n=1 Tax=Selenomonas ruminantium TaxID=971 RepID=A0A1H3ZT54_SELRU|nr:cell division FtsA domain-containing protein [Selenomonas ruminantium]SEA26444.1 cell division protein FtsA [Selenomonas ruminantium]